MAIGDGGVNAMNVVGLAKLESTPGDDPTVAAADAILFDQFIAPPLNAAVHERAVANGGELNVETVVGRHSWDPSVVWEMKGSGTADTPPEASPLYQAAGLKETINAGTDVTYTPDLTDGGAASLESHLDDDHSFVARYFRGSLSFEAGEVGAPIKVTLAGRSIYEEPGNASSPSSPVYDSTLPPVFQNGSFTLGGNAYNLRSMSVDFGTTIAEKTGVGAETGYNGFKLTRFNPTGQMVLELDSEADKNWFAHFIAGTTGALDMTVGGTAGNKIDIDCPVVKLNAPPELGEDNGLALVTLSFELRDSATQAKDWITIKHY